MTQPTRSPRRWAALWAKVTSRLGSVRLGGRLWLAIAAGAVVVIALAVWVNALATPAHRVGQPTASVAPLPEISSATPTPTESGTPSGSSSPTPSVQVPKMKSSEKFDTAGVDKAPVSTSGQLRRYSVRVETSAKLKADRIAGQIANILNDPRSWAGSGGIRFALTSKPEAADFSFTLGSPRTAGGLCKPDGVGTCTDGADVVIDAAMWKTTGATYAGSAQDWQAYLVNHGLGHLLGEKNATCAKKASPAPVMMSQATDLSGCVANPWPFP